MENGQKRIRDAQTLVLRRLADEKSKAARVLKVAEALAQNQVRLAKAKLDSFALKAASRKGSESLTDFRAFWDTIGTALSQREKVLLDTVKEPAKSVLWMLPFEFGRFGGQSANPLPGGAGGPGRGEGRLEP